MTISARPPKTTTAGRPRVPAIERYIMMMNRSDERRLFLLLSITRPQNEEDGQEFKQY
jgi:hypothetical protein